MSQVQRELCFIYNAQSGVAHALMDYVHKIVSPQTYACSLCSVTYGNLGMHRQWASYLRGLPFKTRFLYEDTQPKHLGALKLPAAFVVVAAEHVTVAVAVPEVLEKVKFLLILIQIAL